MTLARWLVLLGCIVLFCAGIVHILGYSFVIPVLYKAGVDVRIIGAVKALWLVFSAHLMLLSVGILLVSRLRGSRPVVLLLALIPVADSILMYHFVGPFIGSYMVSAAALLLLAGAWLMPRGVAASSR